jgi:hypothetical protein
MQALWTACGGVMILVDLYLLERLCASCLAGI